MLGTVQYSQIMGSIVIGGYFLLFWHPISQIAVSTVHMPVYDYLVPLVTCTLLCCCLSNTIIVIIIEFWDFRGHCYAIHKYRYWYLVLVCTVLGGRWRDSRVVSVLDFRSSSRGSSPADRRWSRSNLGPVALCTMGLGLLNPPSLNGR